MALFRKPRRQRNSDATKSSRRERAQGGPPLFEQLKAIAAASENPEDALEPALRAIVETTQAAAGALCLFDPRHQVLRLSAEIGLTDEGCRRLRTIRRGDPTCWDIPLHGVVNRRAYLIENAQQNRYVPQLVEEQVGMRTIACIPVYSGLSALASLLLVSAPPRAFAEHDITMLWRPLRELATMIEAVRRQVAPAEGSNDLSPAMPLDMLSVAAERDRMRTELAGRSAEFERLALQLTSNREEMGRLYVALEAATAERGELSRELERVRAQNEDTTTLAGSLEEAKRERQRLVEALEASAAEAESREQRAIAQARHDAESAANARAAEWEAAKKALLEQLATSSLLAEERAREAAELNGRVSQLESGVAADRGRDNRREGEIARLTAALESAAARETDLRARLAAREGERLGAVDVELQVAREAQTLAEAGRARAEERASSLDAELQAVRRMLDEAQAETAQAREEIARLRTSEHDASAEAEKYLRALSEAESSGVEARTRLEAAERVVGEITAERDQAYEEARTHQSAVARAEARGEAMAAERDQLKEALARSEAECVRLRSALESAQTEDARVEGLLARERTEIAELGERLAEAEASVARLEAITIEQRSEITQRDAEIVRLTAEHAEMLAERDRWLSDRSAAETTISVDTADLEAAASLSPDAPATVTRSDVGVTVINVESASVEREFVPTGAPVVVVLDADQRWTALGIEGHDVAVIKPGATSVTRIAELQPTRVIANLAAPGTLTTLLALRAGGSTGPLWGCVADPPSGRAFALSAIEPVVGPIDPDAIITALGPYAARDGRIVTTGADVDALMSLRQALSRRRASVSMAWDAKQAREMLGVVKPHAVVVDMSMPKRDACGIVAAVGALDPIPLLVLVVGSGDPATEFVAVLGDPPRDSKIETIQTVFAMLAAANDETLPQVKQKAATKLQVAMGPRWVG
jgi:CheY-like chemotaxis protein